MESDAKWRLFNSKYISLAYLGEKDGRLALVIILDAKDNDHMVEEFNGKIVSFLHEKFGDSCMKEIITVNLNKLIRVHHNYMPHINMENGVIKKDWLDDMIFVDESSEEEIKQGNKLERFL